MPQKRNEVEENAKGAPLGKEEDEEEDELDRTEDVHEKAHRRKRGRTP